MPVPSITSEMASNLPWLRSILNDPFRKQKLNDALRRWKIHMQACECKGYVNARCFWYQEMLWLHLSVEQPFRGARMNMESYSFHNALLMCLHGRRGRGVRVWLFCSWQRPWGLLAGVFHGRMRKDATMKIVLLIPLCLVSSATAHNGLNSILPPSIKAPVVAAHCQALFGAKKWR